MRYKLIILEFVEGKLRLNVIPVACDRSKVTTNPHSGGFYYIPETMDTKEGIEILRDYLIKFRQDYIHSLQNEINQLKEIK